MVIVSFFVGIVIGFTMSAILNASSEADKKSEIEVSTYKTKSKIDRVLISKNISDEISPTKKPDWDNIGKIVSDALNKFAYKDDSQITDVRIFKKYSTIPKVIVKILEY